MSQCSLHWISYTIALLLMEKSNAKWIGIPSWQTEKRSSVGSRQLRTAGATGVHLIIWPLPNIRSQRSNGQLINWSHRQLNDELKWPNRAARLPFATSDVPNQRGYKYIRMVSLITFDTPLPIGGRINSDKTRRIAQLQCVASRPRMGTAIWSICVIWLWILASV